MEDRKRTILAVIIALVLVAALLYSFEFVCQNTSVGIG